MQTIPIDPKKPWNETGFQMEAGKTYRLKAETVGDDPYKDDNQPCNPDGPTGFRGWLFDRIGRDLSNPFNPLHRCGHGKIKRLRVLQDRNGKRASFLTVIGAIGKNDDQNNVFVIGSGCEVVAHRTGELVVFCNDWPGGYGGSGEERFQNSASYSNNKGQILVTVETR
jgi:hypothetical protein